MKERPILFSGEMVRAILDGRKTVTRRVVKPQPKFTTGCPCCTEEAFLKSPQEKRFDRKHWGFKCPYGQPGDRLWVRETWHMSMSKDRYYYRADAPDMDWAKDWKWSPSIFMRRHVSRLTLEVTGVRVERVQDIKRDEVTLEGVGSTHWQDEEYWVQRRRFSKLWDSINAKRGFGWDKNPWVWVIDFKRLDNASNQRQNG